MHQITHIEVGEDLEVEGQEAEDMEMLMEDQLVFSPRLVRMLKHLMLL